AREGVVAVGPPEAGAVVLVERDDLLGQRLGIEGLHGQVAVEEVEDLGAVFEEEAVAQAAVADAIADDEVVGAVDGEPAIAAIPDRGAQDVAAAHGVADQVIVQAVTAEDAGFAKAAELGVADGAGGMAMIHGVAAALVRIGRLDDDVAAKIGHLAAIFAVAQVLELERLIEHQLG